MGKDLKYKKEYKMLAKLVKENLINTIDVMEYCKILQGDTSHPQCIVDMTAQRVRSLYQRRIG